MVLYSQVTAKTSGTTMKSGKHIKDDVALDRLLNQLPVLNVPDTFQTRVLETIRKRSELPWWKRSFWDWSRGLQLCCGAFGIILSLGIIGFASSVLTSGLESLGTETMIKLQPIANVLMIILTAGARVLSNVIASIDSTYLILLLVPLGMIYLSSLFVGTILFKMSKA